MFYFNLLLGGGLILLGLKKRKNERIPEMKLVRKEAIEQEKLIDTSGINELNLRIDQLQKLVFESLLVKEENRRNESSDIFIEKAQEVEQPISEPKLVEMPDEVIVSKEALLPITKPIPENIKAMLDYESKGLSVQEIASQTHMNKGEVLLLQNLAKHYAK
ncbi:MAG: hypothetical protein WBI17_08400 [Clostridiaceae bacterium]